MFIKSISNDRCRIKFGMTVSCAKRTVKNLSLFTSHFSRECKRYAFTLAEVLITLGIIGVVATITLPSVINNIQNKQLQTSLKTAYSLLQQGLSKLNADKGYLVTPQEYNQGGTFYNDYKNYFKLLYDCGVYHPDQSLCMARASNKTESTNYYNDLVYKTYTGKPNIFTNNLDDGQFVLSNGMLVMIENPSGGIIWISVDINGKKKKPNKLGHDVFTFQLMSDGKLLPMGAKGTQYSEDRYCSKSETGNTVNGIACANKALNDKDFFKNLP